MNYSAGDLDARAICAIMPEDLAYCEYGSKTLQERTVGLRQVTTAEGSYWVLGDSFPAA